VTPFVTAVPFDTSLATTPAMSPVPVLPGKTLFTVTGVIIGGNKLARDTDNISNLPFAVLIKKVFPDTPDII
jgi:hypothetical protein